MSLRRITLHGMLIWLIGMLSARAAEPPADELARLIASRLKHSKGLALDVAGGDPRLAVALAGCTRLTIRCVESSAEAVDRLRQEIDRTGLYGTRITASQEDVQRLNFPSYCANLVIGGEKLLEPGQDQALRELYRVLSPNGIAWIGQRAAGNGTRLSRKGLEARLRTAQISSYEVIEQHGLWARITRPREAGWDEWTHRSHDPANSFGSSDTLSGTEFKPQWISDYRPGLSSAAVAVAGGRVVLASLSYASAPQTTPHIQVLDAYTGTELWARVGQQQLPIDRPPGIYSNRESCSDIAVLGDELYLLASRFCHEFDLTSGETRRSIEIPTAAQAEPDDVWLYLSCPGDTLYGAIGKPPGVVTDWNTMLYRGVSRALFALDRRSGEVRWICRTPASVCSLAVAGGKFYFCDQELNLRALDAQTGVELWHTPLRYEQGTEIAGCSVHRDKVWLLFNQPRGQKDRKGNDVRGAALLTSGHNKRELEAYSTDNGGRLFKADFGSTVAGVSFAGDLVFGSGQHGGEGFAVASAETGVLQWKVRDKLKCTPSLAAPHCFLTQSNACASVVDVQSLRASADTSGLKRVAFTGFRPSCSYPGIPANGMIYHQAEGCACSSPVRGNITLAPGAPAFIDRTPAQRHLRGEAWGTAIEETTAAGWATWRGDAARSGRTAEALPEGLTQAWTRQLAGELLPLAAGQGLVFSLSSNHKLVAFDAESGSPRWQRILEGRPTVAPFLWQGRIYVSDDEGWAWCLRADSGEVVWRFRASLGDERLVAYGEFINRWPARTGVVVNEDIAYFAAGLFPDEGAAVYAVDARTGELRWQEQLQPVRRGGRTAGFMPDGMLALGKNRLYIASGAGAPWQIDLSDPKHALKATGGTHIKGRHIMAAGDDLVAIAPGLEYVHHVHYKSGEGVHRLPVVDQDTAYLLNQSAKGPDLCLVAARRDAYELSQNRAATFVRRKDAGPDVQLHRWKAWPGEKMTTLIQASGTLVSGGQGKVYATRAATGEQLWSLPVSGGVEDLAVDGGRLFVLCEGGVITCFAAPR